MKKTNVLISFLTKGRTLMMSSMLMLTFFLVGATVAHAQQLNPKNATPLQIIQQELAELQASLATLPPVHPKRAHYEPYEAYLIAIVADLQAGMGYHAAVVKNRPLMPEWVNIIPGAAPTKVTAITKEPTNRVKQQ